MDRPPHHKFEQLLEGEVPVSWINEPLEQPQRETATERAQRRWFKQTENE